VLYRTQRVGGAGPEVRSGTLYCMEAAEVPAVHVPDEVLPAENGWEAGKRRAAGPGGKFNEKRRRAYLEHRRQGVPHLTALRKQDVSISPSTYDRYSAAVGDEWKKAVAYARDESMDPIRAVRRAAALEAQPWAVRAEIGNGEDGSRNAAVRGGDTVNILAISGGADGVLAGLAGLVDRLRERERTLEAG
jgi:hypothetical protein